MLNLSHYRSALLRVWYAGVKKDILFKSNTICSQRGEKRKGLIFEAGRVMSKSRVLTSLSGVTVMNGQEPTRL